MPKIYRQRIVDQLLAKKLNFMGAVLIEGAKWCGKSTTAEQHAKSAIFMADPSKREIYDLWARTQINELLDGETPRLIDEWQVYPRIWDAVRFAIDRRQLPGQFILTGSATPNDPKLIAHSGTGRFAWLRMRPMTLWESGDSSGKVSLSALFNGSVPALQLVNAQNLQRIAQLCCRGGWPMACDIADGDADYYAKEYYNAVVHVDFSQIVGMRVNIDRVKRLMRSYARFQGTQTPVKQICADMAPNEASAPDSRTIQNYLQVLRDMFVIEDMPAWNPNVKSRAAIRTADTLYYVDPSIATASLSLGPGSLINDLKAFGLIFETLCVRDLRVYAQPLNGEVFHYRDSSGLECDAVTVLDDGRYGLIEIKLGGEKLIEHGAETLKKLAQKIDTARMPSPAFMMVLTAVGEAAYRRDDNVWVVPIHTLKD